MNPDGSGKRALLEAEGRRLSSWSPDGRMIAFQTAERPGLRRERRRERAAEADVETGELGLPGLVARRAEDRLYCPDPPANRDLRHERRRERAAEAHAGLGVRPPAWSPDGRKIAFSASGRRRGNSEVFVMNADGSAKRRLTRQPAGGHSPDLVARRAEDHVLEPARRQLGGLRHERRRERTAEPHARTRGATALRPGRQTGERSLS